MDVFLANEQELPVDERRITTIARHALRAEGVDDAAELSILLVNADHIRRLNARFAGNDYATDVLAFPMVEDEEATELMLGDVVVCPSVARDHAAEAGHGLIEELDVLVVHGILHLLGYDHQGADDRARMERRLRDVLDSFDAAAGAG